MGRTAKIKDRAERHYRRKKDDVRIYPLPADSKTIVMGCGDRVPEGVNIFLS
jgi:CRISPR-associated protein Cas2